MAPKRIAIYAKQKLIDYSIVNNKKTHSLILSFFFSSYFSTLLIGLEDWALCVRFRLD